MLTRRKLRTLTGSDLGHLTVLPREQASAFCQAGDIIDAAKAQARQITEEAQAEAGTIRLRIRHETAQQLWQEANGLLDEWQAERDEMQDAIVDCARQLVTQALALAFAEKPDEARTEILLRQLGNSLSARQSATLLVHPAQKREVESYLLAQQNTHWQLVEDVSLSKDELCLKSRSGQYTLSWQQLTDAVLSAVADSPDPEEG